MGIAALVLWVVTALGGFVMVGRWIRAGGLHRQTNGAARFPATVVFTHAGLAAAGLVLWIVYLATGMTRLAWIALAVVLVAALFGFVLFSRWAPLVRRKAAVAVGTAGGTSGATAGNPPERHIPVTLVAGHGVLAVATVVLVVLAALFS